MKTDDAARNQAGLTPQNTQKHMGLYLHHFSRIRNDSRQGPKTPINTDEFSQIRVVSGSTTFLFLGMGNRAGK
jgi:hypothetical protein